MWIHEYKAMTSFAQHRLDTKSNVEQLNSNIVLHILLKFILR